MKNSSSYSEFLKQENELTKLKIQAEFGFQIAGESSLNPAIENIWLKQILDYERAMVTSSKITVGEKLGNPVFKPVGELKDEEITEELHKVVDVLAKKNIVLDSVAGAPDSELYRFITEELMKHEIESNSPPNMLTCFIYEEFYPNHEYDIRKISNDLIMAFENKEMDLTYLIPQDNEDEILDIRLKHINRKLQLFKEAFDDVKVTLFEIDSLNINGEKAEVSFRFSFSVRPFESRNYHSLSGLGELTLNYSFEWWSITDVTMEGIV